jgi:uncharacterized protein (DUF1501 family)
MTKPIDTSRREFLRNASLLSVAGTISAPFALNLLSINEAVAATAYTDYKALVCLYLAGGNDSANMILATDDPSWAGYTAARGGNGNIGLAKANLLPITPTTPAGRTFALHPSMTGLQTLFAAKRAAFVANVGTLIDPLADINDFRSNTKLKPANLFSHSDQTTQWHSTNRDEPNYGWGGRMGDLLISSNLKPYFANMSLSGNNVFLAGNTINQYQINSNGRAAAINGMTNLFGINNSPLGDIVTNANGAGTAKNVFEKDHAAAVLRSINAQATLNAVVAKTTVTAPDQYTNIWGGLSGNPLASQLQTVATIIAGHTDLGVNRQVFFVNVGGFDTHRDQLTSHGDLMARVAHAVKYFDDTLRNLPSGDMSSQVTLFTAADFGRTFASNGSGTDHGWGAHHFVVGGAVKGGEIYGTFPPTCVNSATTPNPLDVGSGSLIPTTSVDQYAATLATWFGLDATDIGIVFPHLGKFSPTNLSFMA